VAAITSSPRGLSPVRRSRLHAPAQIQHLFRVLSEDSPAVVREIFCRIVRRGRRAAPAQLPHLGADRGWVR